MIPNARLFVPSIALCSFIFSTGIGTAAPSENTADAAVTPSGLPVPMQQIDINSATLTDLRSLPGIGTAHARKIVAGRPYASTDDLKTRKVLSTAIYERIRDRISAKGPASGGTGNKPDIGSPGSGLH